MKFEVQTFTLCDGWLNCWTDSTEEGEELVYFDTEVAAINAIEKHIADCVEAFIDGNLDSTPSRSDFRVMRVVDAGG